MALGWYDKFDWNAREYNSSNWDEYKKSIDAQNQLLEIQRQQEETQKKAAAEAAKDKTLLHRSGDIFGGLAKSVGNVANKTVGALADLTPTVVNAKKKAANQEFASNDALLKKASEVRATGDNAKADKLIKLAQSSAQSSAKSASENVNAINSDAKTLNPLEWAKSYGKSAYGSSLDPNSGWVPKLVGMDAKASEASALMNNKDIAKNMDDVQKMYLDAKKRGDVSEATRLKASYDRMAESIYGTVGQNADEVGAIDVGKLAVGAGLQTGLDVGNAALDAAIMAASAGTMPMPGSAGKVGGFINSMMQPTWGAGLKQGLIQGPSNTIAAGLTQGRTLGDIALDIPATTALNIGMQEVPVIAGKALSGLRNGLPGAKAQIETDMTIGNLGRVNAVEPAVPNSVMRKYLSDQLGDPVKVGQIPDEGLDAAYRFAQENPRFTPEEIVTRKADADMKIAENKIIAAKTTKELAGLNEQLTSAKTNLKASEAAMTAGKTNTQLKNTSRVVSQARTDVKKLESTIRSIQKPGYDYAARQAEINKALDSGELQLFPQKLSETPVVQKTAETPTPEPIVVNKPTPKNVEILNEPAPIKTPTKSVKDIDAEMTQASLEGDHVKLAELTKQRENIQVDEGQLRSYVDTAQTRDSLEDTLVTNKDQIFDTLYKMKQEEGDVKVAALIDSMKNDADTRLGESLYGTSALDDIRRVVLDIPKPKQDNVTFYRDVDTALANGQPAPMMTKAMIAHETATMKLWTTEWKKTFGPESTVMDPNGVYDYFSERGNNTYATEAMTGGAAVTVSRSGKLAVGVIDLDAPTGTQQFRIAHEKVHGILSTTISQDSRAKLIIGAEAQLKTDPEFKAYTDMRMQDSGLGYAGAVEEYISTKLAMKELKLKGYGAKMDTDGRVVISTKPIALVGSVRTLFDKVSTAINKFLGKRDVLENTFKQLHEQKGSRITNVDTMSHGFRKDAMMGVDTIGDLVNGKYKLPTHDRSIPMDGGDMAYVISPKIIRTDKSVFDNEFKYAVLDESHLSGMQKIRGENRFSKQLENLYNDGQQYHGYSREQLDGMADGIKNASYSLDQDPLGYAHQNGKILGDMAEFPLAAKNAVIEERMPFWKKIVSDSDPDAPSILRDELNRLDLSDSEQGKILTDLQGVRQMVEGNKAEATSSWEDQLMEAAGVKKYSLDSSGNPHPDVPTADELGQGKFYNADTATKTGAWIKGHMGVDSPILTSFRTKWEDFRLPLKKFEQQHLGKVSDETNLYQALENSESIISAQQHHVDVMNEDLVLGMTKTAKADGIDPFQFKDEVNGYLAAKSGLERIAKYNKDVVYGNADPNVTIAQLTKTIADAEASPHFQDIQAFSVEVQKMSKKTLDVLYDGGSEFGVISKQEFATLNETYPNHVKLTRDLSLDSEGNPLANVLIREDYPSGGGSTSVRNSGLKKIKGGNYAVDDIWANQVEQLKAALAKVEKNKTAHVAVNMANYWNSLPEARTLNTQPGNQLFTVTEGLPVGASKNTITAQYQGKPVTVTINDDNLANAITHMDAVHLGAITKMSQTMNGIRGRLATQWKLSFAVRNKIRDTQEMINYISSIHELKGQSHKAIASTLATDMKTVRDYHHGVQNKETVLYQQMIDDGGAIGGFAASTQGDIKKSINDLIKFDNSKLRQNGKVVSDFFGNWNDVAENSSRFTIYKAALNAGESRPRAAWLSKEAGINFQRHGGSEWNTLARSSYMFFNPSIQGMTRTFRAWVNNPAEFAKFSLALGSVTLAANSWNDTVDENWRDDTRLSAYTRATNMIVLTPWQNSKGEHYMVKVPLGFSYAPIKTAMDFGIDLAKGKTTATDAIKKSAEALIYGYNPAGNDFSFAQLLPTQVGIVPARYLAELATNQNFMGTPIKPKGKENLPASWQYYNSTPETPVGSLAVKASRLIADLTGAKKSNDSKGLIEISPESMLYAMDQLISGAGRDVKNLYNTASDAIQGKPLKTSSMPFVESFVSEMRPSQKGEQEMYNITARRDPQSVKEAIIKQRIIQNYPTRADIPENEIQKLLDSGMSQQSVRTFLKEYDLSRTSKSFKGLNSVDAASIWDQLSPETQQELIDNGVTN